MANLITLEDYKEAEGISNPKDDLKLNAIIPSVSQLVKTYCGNSIVDHYSTNKIETLNIDWGTHVVQLTESPVHTIVSVEERDSYKDAYKTLTTTDHEYYLDAATDSILRTNGANGYTDWRIGPGSVRVTYQAGYSVCPADLKLAVIDLVTYYHKDEYKERKVMAGASIQNAGSSSQANNVAFPDHIKRVLDLYKNF
jgi:hypothetical protein